MQETILQIIAFVVAIIYFLISGRNKNKKSKKPIDYPEQNTSEIPSIPGLSDLLKNISVEQKKENKPEESDEKIVTNTKSYSTESILKDKDKKEKENIAKTRTKKQKSEGLLFLGKPNNLKEVIIMKEILDRKYV